MRDEEERVFFIPHPSSLLSDPLQLLPRALVADIAGVQRRGGLEEEDVRLLVRDGPVLDAARHDQELPLLQPHLAVAELHPEPPADDQEQLVLRVVVVPDEGALELDELHHLAVQLADDLRAPLLTDSGQLLRQVDLVHSTILPLNEAARWVSKTRPTLHLHLLCYEPQP